MYSEVNYYDADGNCANHIVEQADESIRKFHRFKSLAYDLEEKAYQRSQHTWNYGREAEYRRIMADRWEELARQNWDRCQKVCRGLICRTVTYYSNETWREGNLFSVQEEVIA